MSYKCRTSSCFVASNDAKALFKNERQEWLLTRLFSWTGHGSGYFLVAIVKVVI